MRLPVYVNLWESQIQLSKSLAVFVGLKSLAEAVCGGVVSYILLLSLGAH